MPDEELVSHKRIRRPNSVVNESRHRRSHTSSRRRRSSARGGDGRHRLPDVETPKYHSSEREDARPVTTRSFFRRRRLPAGGAVRRRRFYSGGGGEISVKDDGNIKKKTPVLRGTGGNHRSSRGFPFYRRLDVRDSSISGPSECSSSVRLGRCTHYKTAERFVTRGARDLTRAHVENSPPSRIQECNQSSAVGRLESSCTKKHAVTSPSFQTSRFVISG